jgi:hypothetical protein
MLLTGGECNGEEVDFGSQTKKFSQGYYSQSYQDVLLDEIFKNIGTKNIPPFCVEFGFNSGSFTEGTGTNVANLVLNKNWNCLLLDGDNENADINLHKHLLTSGNISEIFRAYNAPKVPEYISIDVDSTDLWLFRALFPLDASIAFRRCQIRLAPHL